MGYKQPLEKRYVKGTRERNQIALWVRSKYASRQTKEQTVKEMAKECVQSLKNTTPMSCQKVKRTLNSLFAHELKDLNFKKRIDTNQSRSPLVRAEIEMLLNLPQLVAVYLGMFNGERNLQSINDSFYEYLQEKKIGRGANKTNMIHALTEKLSIAFPKWFGITLETVQEEDKNA